MTITDKNIRFDAGAREAILRGVNILADAVKATLGPGGRNVIIDGPLTGRPRPRMTKDGVTVARAVRVSDPFERMGAEIAKDAAEKQNEESGDGTTTVTVLMQAIVREGVKYIAAGMNPTDLRRGIETGAGFIRSALTDMARPISEFAYSSRYPIQDVAFISANGDLEIAGKIHDAMTQVGAGGVLTVEESRTGETELEVVSGMMFDRGYAYPIFINKPNYTCELENPVILVFDGKISRLADITPLLEQCVAEGRPALLIADGYEDAIMQTLVLNKTGGGLQNCPVRTPAFGELKKELLQDIACVTGASLISHTSEVSLYRTRIEHCGSAKKVVVKNNCTVIVEGAGQSEEVRQRCDFIRSEMAEAKGDEKTNREMRLAGMTGGIAVIKIGGATDVEIRERKDRVEDAIHATKAAAKSGILPGGGAALAHAALRLETAIDDDAVAVDNDDQRAGLKILCKALFEPLHQIARNAGADGADILGTIKREARDCNYGYDAYAGEYGDLTQRGVIDPASVVISAVANAASVGGLLLTTEAVLGEIKEDADAA